MKKEYQNKIDDIKEVYTHLGQDEVFNLKIPHLKRMEIAVNIVTSADIEHRLKAIENGLEYIN